MSIYTHTYKDLSELDCPTTQIRHQKDNIRASNSSHPRKYLVVCFEKSHYSTMRARRKKPYFRVRWATLLHSNHSSNTALSRSLVYFKEGQWDI